MDFRYPLCSFTASVFNNFIDALKPFTDKRPDTKTANTLIYLEGNKEAQTVTGWACDGFSLAKQVCTPDEIREDFAGYIAVPRLRASSADAEVFISKSDDAMLVSFGDVTFRTSQPQKEVNYREIYEQVKLADEDMLHIGINRKKLATAATSLYSQALKFKSQELPIILSIPANPLSAIRLAQGGNERFILPVRTNLPGKNVFNIKNQGGH